MKKPFDGAKAAYEDGQDRLNELRRKTMFKYTVLLRFDNGFTNDRNSFDSYRAAIEFCRNNVSLTGSIRRIEIRSIDGTQSMWDRDWTPLSRATLYKDYL